MLLGNKELVHHVAQLFNPVAIPLLITTIKNKS